MRSLGIPGPFEFPHIPQVGPETSAFGWARMRELRGQGVVQVLKVHTDDNPADLFTKVLKGPAFIKHRRTCMNLPGDIGQDRMTGSSQRESGNVPARSVLARA